MKLQTFAVSVALALAAGAASAATVSFTVINASGDGSTAALNTADVYAPGYSAFVPAGATMDANVVTPPPGTTSGTFRSPWDGTGIEDDADRTYFAVGPTPNDPDPATLTFGSAVSSYTLLWGSIDEYNELTFTGLGSGEGDVTILGADVADAVNAFSAGTCAATGTDNRACTALLSFTVADSSGAADTFGGMSFTSTGTQAFEFATPVPLPAAGWMLIAGVGGLAALKRRKRKQS